jgi:hypothetical protein
VLRKVFSQAVAIVQEFSDDVLVAWDSSTAWGRLSLFPVSVRDDAEHVIHTCSWLQYMHTFGDTIIPHPNIPPIDTNATEL